MGTHEQAWTGMSIVIFATEPLVPMQLEQAIAAAAPSNETRLESYEDYSDAQAFCQKSQNTGLVIVDETCGDPPPDTIFANLAAPFEKATGIAAGGVVLHNGKETTRGLKAVQSESRILAYLSRDSILDSRATKATLESIWHTFIEQFERFFVPQPLARTLRSIAKATGYSEEAQRVTDRCSSLLSGTLNLSWLDMFALRWFPIVSHLSRESPDSVSCHAQLLSLVSRASFLQELDLRLVATSKAPLAQRVSTVANLLLQAKSQHDLLQLINAVEADLSPRSSALLKVLVRNKRKISEIFEQEGVFASTYERAG